MMKNVKMFLAVLMLAFPFAANSALIAGWQAHDPCPPHESGVCWEYVGHTNHGDGTLLNLANELKNVTHIVKYDSDVFVGEYELVFYKGGTSLWAFEHTNQWANQFSYGISYVAYFDPQPVPEPLPLAMLGMGLIGMTALRRRKTA